MVKLGFSAFVILSALFTSRVSASAIRRQTTDSGTSSTNVSNSSTVASCNESCATVTDILAESCANAGTPNPTGELLVPCGCTNAYAAAQQACSRCTLSFSKTGTILAKDTAIQQQNYDFFQLQCAEAGLPIPNIDIDIPQLAVTVDRPISFAFEIPSSIYDASFPNYIGAVCLRPDQVTPLQCIIGDSNWVRCPNPDVAGILVRVSAYLANLLLGIILMYSPTEASTAVWTQLLTVYSLLLSGIIAISSDNLSRFHSGMTTFLVMSPLSSTLVAYAVLGFCGRVHRLDAILSGRREHLIPRLLVIAFAIISLALIIYTDTADVKHFSTVVCESDDAYKTFTNFLGNLLFVPYAAVIIVILFVVEDATALSALGLLLLIVILLPFLLLVGSFTYAVIKQRRVLALRYRVESNRWKIWVMWDFLAVQYPLMHFCGVFFVPMLYWVLILEFRTIETPDNLFSLSFGQILAMFVILPPLLQVFQLAPEAKGWFMNLTFTRLITGRRDVVPPNKEHSLEDGMGEKFRVDPYKEI
ncbi:hypothetical protein B0H16DRAFT_1891257 [Mycena metata]|uniref:Uncharacterized protein n=1 Tax=Mycena metata TaxID=1033252 RepID=A0AAD7MZ43_9AGAR|nr:hypothetical protein B0H16DRAFT_1891257 [Mycena metata]